MEYKKAKSIILQKYKGSAVLAAYDGDSQYIFAIKPIKMKEDIVDNLFSVNKATGKISEFSPVKDPKAFSKIYKNKIE